MNKPELPEENGRELSAIVAAAVKRLVPPGNMAFVLVCCNGPEIHILSNAAPLGAVPTILAEAAQMSATDKAEIYKPHG